MAEKGWNLRAALMIQACLIPEQMIMQDYTILVCHMEDQDIDQSISRGLTKAIIYMEGIKGNNTELLFLSIVKEMPYLEYFLTMGMAEAVQHMVCSHWKKYNKMHVCKMQINITNIYGDPPGLI